ncbi:prickle-like protein 4 isoform X2 [Tiliqua scincoides]|uniref:prickle-like protein 4 isoform X2 n=1 Tax=Tiliqua scincoides TaxID=71010 RepID=UPI003461853E
MSLPSPTWSLREKPPCSGTLAALIPASSSDSDSGCALEDYLGPTTEVCGGEVSPHFGSHSPDAVPDAVQTQLRIKALLQQLPPQDCDERYCPSIGEEERKQLRKFAVRRQQESLGQGVMCPVPSAPQGYICKRCGKRMNGGEQGVFAPKLGDQSCWHPACFVCHTCHQPLVDLIYFHQDGKIYCGRHHAEFFRPRCASCDQLIFTSECMEAEGMRWHEEHFCCLECDLPLGARRYVMKGGQPCCCACFENLYADVCEACGETIAMESLHASGNSSGHSEFSGKEEVNDLFLKAVIAPQHDELRLVADSLQEEEGTSRTHPLETGQSPSSARESQILEASLPQTSQQHVGDHQFRSCLPTASNSSVLTMDIPEGLQESELVAEQEDTWCPTCSSSSESDSEPEGFFFGKPIPKPGARRIALPCTEQQQALVKGTRWTARVRANSKQCSIC